MSDLNFESMTDDDLFDIQQSINAERRRRNTEVKLPVYCFDGESMKSLSSALKDLRDHTERAINYPGGPEKYFDSAINEGVKADLLSLKIEFWSKSEYDARPERSWG